MASGNELTNIIDMDYNNLRRKRKHRIEMGMRRDGDNDDKFDKTGGLVWYQEQEVRRGQQIGAQCWEGEQEGVQGTPQYFVAVYCFPFFSAL
jgi:hypothetical protein